jgi:hypothetical protein
MIQLSSIKPNDKNPRTINEEKFEKLVKSLKEFPKMMELRPIITKDGIILGGNMRYKALLELHYIEVPNKWIRKADDLSEDERKRFIIADNIEFGEHDYEALSSDEWSALDLEEWGLELPGDDLDSNLFDDTFNLNSDAKAPYQQMAFTLADDQVKFIKEKLDIMKKSDDFKLVETFGNENKNGNALYLLFKKWEELSKLKLK